MLQTFSFDGTGRQIDAKATFFRYESGSAAGADEAVRVYADGNDLGTYLPGDAIKLPVAATRWVITPVSAALAATVRLGTGTVESARLVGTVRVVDDDVSKTLAGAEFFGSTSKLSSSASTYPVAGMKAGTRNLVVRRISVSSTTAQRCSIVRATGNPTASASTDVMHSKKLGGAVASAVRSIGTSANAVPSTADIPGAQHIAYVFVPANEAIALPLDRPIVIEPGYALFAVGGVLNTDVIMTFDAAEE